MLNRLLFRRGKNLAVAMEMEKRPKSEDTPLTFSKPASRKKVLVAVGVCCGVAAVIALAVGLGVGLSQGGSEPPAPSEPPINGGPISDPSERIDCYPEGKWGGANVTKEDCESRGCTYDPPTDGSNAPVCYVSSDSPLGSGYRVLSDEVDGKGTRRIELESRSPSAVRIKRSVKGQQPRTLDKTNAVFEVEFGGENILHFKLYPAGAPRFEVPRSILDITLPRLRPGAPTSYTFNITSFDPFAFKIIRQSTGTVLWDTSVGGTAVSDQFLTISTRLPSFNVYGFGENVHNSFRHDFNYTTWPLFARDQWVSKGVENHYSVHPFYTCLEETGDSHGVFLLNSNAMDYSFTPLPMLTYRTIGGVLDFYFFLGPTPENVVQQYTGLIGRPYMPPYWALGFQLCRYGYNTIERMQDAVNRTKTAGIPQDIQYADIDHMNESMIFTVDNVNFHGLADYFTDLRNNGMRTIIILDPCMISNVSDYEPFHLGLEKDIFIKWPNQTIMPPEDYSLTNTTTLLGYVWPKGKVAFPDFFLNRTHDVWSTLIENHVKVLPFDGLWIDMNEPANFGTNEQRPWNWPEHAKPYWSLKCPTGPLDDPSYRTMAAYVYDKEAKAANRSGARLSDKTVCMISVQGENAIYRHYDVHNLYGASQALPTLQALRKATGQRGIVVSRSTFPGTGRHVGHWLGDNFSEWPYMKDSIVGMLEFNLFGFPYIGADICGFFGDTTAELCKRWMQLGAFYPYARNHNQIDSKVEQDPANFNEEVTRLSREALLIRYHLLPYLYTLFHSVHTHGGTVIRPLHHEFPRDSITWGIDRQFLWGSGFMIVPILEENQAILKYYLPSGRWYDFYTNVSMAGGSWREMAVVSNSSIPLFVRGGTIFPTQDPANNTHFSRLNPFRCLVYLDADDGKAAGELFWDDGVSVDTYETNLYYFARMDSTKDEFHFRIQHNNIPTEMSSLRLSSVQVVGVANAPAQVLTMSGTKETTILPDSQYVYSPSTRCLVIKDLEHSMAEDLTIQWRLSPIPTIDEVDRIDCMPEGENSAQCIAKGCIWNVSGSAGVPSCYLNSSSYGYVYVNTSEANSTHDTIHLQHLPGASMFGSDSDQVNVYLDYVNDWLIRIKISPVGVEPVYEVPVPLHLPTPVGSSTRLYRVSYESNRQQPFHMRIHRTDSNQVVWDTSIGGLTISPQFLQLVARLPTTYVYGIGETSRSSFRRKFEYETVAMFARDQPPGDPKANLYGVHPYYVCVDNITTGSAHGVLLLNSNAMELVLGPAPSVTYRTIGGLLDFYFIFGDSSETVTARYTQLIGRPYLPPYWALGFQLSRYGYNTLSNMEAALQRTLDAEIPVDVQYGDIDHMETAKDFTYNLVNFAELPQYVGRLHNQGMRFIIILDPAIMSTDKNYWPYLDGVSADVFIRWPLETNHSDFYRFNSTYMYGYVWPPGEAVFPDFFKTETQNWWRNCILQHHRNAFPFDGLWIDMNEPANFGTNENKPWNWPDNREPWSLKCPKGPLDDPPYKPKAIWGPRLSEKTICLVGLQTDGVRNFTQYDVHNVYGWSQTEPTLKAIREATGERSIVITRSTYVGSGTFAGHWLGDNDSQWPHMLQSIVGCLDFNLFGIPYIGADVCGYFNNATAELCNRWTQLGAFYTFSRNHNGINFRDQDPASFGPVVAESAKFITEMRYSLLPYLYTLFFRAHVNGSTVIRPLFHEFKMDLNTYDISRQFLWGPALLITPVLEENQNSVCGYLAKETRWFSLFNGLEEPVTGAVVCFDAPFNRIPLHVRGGQIIVTQEPAINTNRSRLNPFGLIAAPNSMDTAAGELFWDDGISDDTVTLNQYYLFNYALKLASSGSNSTLTAQTLVVPTTSLSLSGLASIRVFGVSQMPSGVITTEQGVVSSVDSIFYDSTTRELYLYNLTLRMDSNWTAIWW